MNRNYNALSACSNTSLNLKKVLGSATNLLNTKKLNLFSFFLIVIFGFNAHAQVSNLVNPTYGYTFLNTTSTYTSLGAGGTVFQTGAAISTDAVSAAIPLPFAFTFNGIKQNRIFISNNGFITFGIAPAANLYSPIQTIAAGSGFDGVICGSAVNCVASTAVGTAPEIRYGLNGTDFAVQFQDIGQSVAPTMRITYQILLKADGKTIQIVYGTNNAGASGASQLVVGLRGSNEQDWNNRTLSSGQNWNTAGGAAGTLAQAMSATATTTLPASGRTFQWTPNAYVPTYLATPFSTTQDFTSWANGSGPSNVPSSNWATNGYGNASWQIDNTTASTTGSGWTNTPATEGVYTPADYANAVGGHSARFHSFRARLGQAGYLDYYVDLSGGLGALTLDFYSINPGGTDVLQIFLSTDGGASFAQVGTDIGTSMTWTARSISLGAVTSATSIIRFKAVSDFGGDDIGIDNVVINQPAPACPVLNTNTGLSYCTIQAAIDAVETLNGHTITIASGTYSEQVLINKSLTITSSGATQPEINFLGTVTGKPTLFDVSADNVTINNIHFNVDLAKLKSAIIASSSVLDNVVITNNLIDAYGTPVAGAYGDRNAVSVNYTGTANYRVASGGVNNITFTGNTVNGALPGSYFRAGIATDESGGTFSGNTLQTINHDVISRFGGNGNISITGNNCNGGGVEVVEMNAGAGIVTISGNNFNGAFANTSAPGSAVLRLQNNQSMKVTNVSGNTFTNHQWAVMLANYNSVTLNNNTFTPLAGSTTFHHVAVLTKGMSTNSATIVQTTVDGTFTNNTFNGSGTTGGTALSFHNHDTDAASFGTFTIGTAGNENSFNDGISRNIFLDNQTGTSSAATFPNYTGLIGAGAGALTTMGLWSGNFDATNNRFDVGAGLQLPSAMSTTSLFTTEDRIQHAVDAAGLGFVTVKANNTYVTTNSFATPTSISASIQRGIDAAATGFTVNVAPGTYAENVIVNKSVTVSGPNSATSGCGTRVAEAVVTTSSAGIAANEIFHVAASNVTITGLTIDGDNTAITSGFTSTNGADIDAAEGVTIYENGINNLTVTNNIFRNLSYFGVTLHAPSGAATSGHVVSDNKMQDMGTYDTGSGIQLWGGGVLIGNNQYAAISNNCMDNVRIGIQTDNFYFANPGAAASQVFSNNTMTNVRRRGIFYNLHYNLASPFTVSGNTISGVMNATETTWDGILVASQSTASTFSGNTINGSAITNPSNGIIVWNVKSASPAAISGGTISSVTNGVLVSNYDGYPTAGSNAPDGGHASLSSIAISSCTTGIRVKDNTLSAHAPASATIGSGVAVTGGTSGLILENASATVGASLSDMAFNGQSGQYVTLLNNTNAIDATAATFGGTTGASASVTQNLAIEDKISHKIDNGALGLVTVKANNTFVTTNSFVTPATTIADIQRGVDAAATGFTVNVGPGLFTNDVLVNKQVTVLGAGAGVTTVSGPIGGVNSTTMWVQAPGVIIDGFTITREGNNVADWNNPLLNSAGIAIQSQTVTGEIRNCEITGMRTAIDINNSNGNNIHNNNIHSNRTGLIFRNQTDNTTVVNNIIHDNFTVGILFLDGSNMGTGTHTALNSNFNDNSISGNWYGEVVDRQTGGSLPAPGANPKNFACNWYGSTAPVVTTANSTEPGYAAQIPVMYGGTATAPGGQPDIAGPASANILYAPLAISGADLGGDANDGFQPSAPCAAPCDLVVTATPTAIVCNGGTSTVTVTATGGSGTYTSGTGTFTVVAGTYTYTVTDLNGCVDSETITITQPAVSAGTTTITTCDSYTWAGPLGNGTTYTTSGTYTNVTTNGSGCTHTQTLVLTINNSTTNGTMTVTNAGPYTWAGPLGSGLTYTSSGVYTFTTTNAAGCPNVATLTLTVTPVNSFVIGTSCGATLSAMNVTIIAPLVSGATTYTFRIINTVTSAQLIVNRPVNSLSLSNYAGITLGTQYTIAVSTNGGATYGPPCVVITPAPTSTIGAQCGTTLTSMAQFVYATYAPIVTGYRFRVTNTATSAFYVYDAVSGQNRFSFNQLPAAFAMYGTVYSVEVALRNTDGSYLPYGAACNITTPAFPTSEIVLSQCDMTATSNTQTISAVAVSGATGYRFQLTNGALSYNFSIDRGVNNFNLSMFPGLMEGTTYTVRVAVRIGGVWGPLTGKPCNLTTPGLAPEVPRTMAAGTTEFAAVAYPNPFAESFMFDVKTAAESTIQIKVYDMLGKQVENRNVEASAINSIIFGDNYPSGVYNVILSQGENTKILRVIKR